MKLESPCVIPRRGLFRLLVLPVTRCWRLSVEQERVTIVSATSPVFWADRLVAAGTGVLYYCQDGDAHTRLHRSRFRPVASCDGDAPIKLNLRVFATS